MWKKGGWISALKKAFTHTKSKKKFDTAPGTYGKEKKMLGQRWKEHGDVNSFVPFYREPSSIEKILDDVEKEQQYKAYKGTNKNQQPKSTIMKQNASTNTSKNAASDKAETISSSRKSMAAPCKAKLIVPSKQAITQCSNPITSNYVHISATKIQAAYKGYMARRNYTALRGLLRLHNMMKRHSVKRQTMNTMKSMQLLVRIQTQIHERRIQMMENQNLLKHEMPWSSGKETFGSSSKWIPTNQLKREPYEEWDDSILTKVERDASAKRKIEAVIRRERALAYAYYHQSQTTTPALIDVQSGGALPVWWKNWFERSIPSDTNKAKTLTPRFSKLIRTRSSNRLQRAQTRTSTRDNDSLTSCPTIAGTSTAAVPSYMASTFSANAKIRSSALESGGGAKGVKKRFSFALNQGIGTMRLFSAMKGAASGGRHRSKPSIGALSVDSTVSLPARLI